MRYAVIAAILAAVFVGWPLAREEKAGACEAVELRALKLSTDQRSEQGRRNVLTIALEDTILRGMASGEMAAAYMRAQYPGVPSLVSCAGLYWFSLADQNVLKFTPQPSPPPPPSAPLPEPPAPPPALSRVDGEPNPTSNPAPMSQETSNTLERLRALQRQQRPPTAVANPTRGGAPQGGGNPLGDDTSLLSADQIRSIGDAVRRCWTYDAGARDADSLRVLLEVTTDESGTARLAKIAPEDAGRMGNPVFRNFAERAVRAVLSPQCANLPLPRTMLGQSRVLKVQFSP